MLSALNKGGMLWVIVLVGWKGKGSKFMPCKKNTRGYDMMLLQSFAR